MEEWVARRIDSAHVLKPRTPSRRRNYLYIATEFIDGQTLTQWMIDNPDPPLDRVREIVEQIAKGLQAFHRRDMLHRDLRPDNIMIDRTGTAKIIDFGAVHVAGIGDEAALENLGTAQFTAPEYFLSEGGSTRSDIFSLGVIAYQMLTGDLPYGAAVARTRTRAQQRKLRYRSARSEKRDVPAWIDGALRKAVHLEPRQRYEELSEFLFDLRHPNRRFTEAAQAPLIERDPLLVWKGVSAALFIAVLVLLYLLGTGARF
jgi:serine/threonine protein kinase